MTTRTGCPEAVEAYQQATDFYDAENQPRRADGCREKVATISARLGAYDDAITQFDALGRSALQSNLGKFNAKKWFTYSVLCCLAREDLVKAQKLLGEDLCHFGDDARLRVKRRWRIEALKKSDFHTGEYASLDYTLVGTREHDLLEALCAACESQDEEAVATAAAEYDRVKRLDPWTTKLLLAVKDTCASVELPEPVVEAAAGLKLEDADELPDLAPVSAHNVGVLTHVDGAWGCRDVYRGEGCNIALIHTAPASIRRLARRLSSADVPSAQQTLQLDAIRLLDVARGHRRLFCRALPSSIREVVDHRADRHRQPDALLRVDGVLVDDYRHDQRHDLPPQTDQRAHQRAKFGDRDENEHLAHGTRDPQSQQHGPRLLDHLEEVVDLIKNHQR